MPPAVPCKAITPQIAWHGKEPVLSIDVSVTGFVATGGADNEVVLWRLRLNKEPGEAVCWVQTLTIHSKPVNCVRFSPDGLTLASAGDDGAIVLWKDQGERPGGGGGGAFGEAPRPTGSVNWRPLMLGNCGADVYDLCWSPSGERLFSGCVSGSCIVWDAATKKKLQEISEHEHFVQGVTWDPRDEFLVSMSGDRSARIYRGGGTGAGAEYVCCNVLTKRLQLPPPTDAAGTPPAGALKQKTTELFLDDSVPSFFRRLSWSTDGSFNLTLTLTLTPTPTLTLTLTLTRSPDGSFLLLPCGQHRPAGASADDAPLPTTHVFARGALQEPCAHLPGPTKPVVATRCCPVLFELRTTTSDAGAAASADGPQPAAADVEALSLTALKELIASAGLTLDGCIEKPDIRQRAREAQAALATAAGTAGTAGTAAGAAGAAGAAPSESNWMGLPYRVLWAVASLDAVLLYDSQASEPLLLAKNMHYAALSDVAWLPNGRGLLVSSTDGYCSILTFSAGALGKRLPDDQLPQCMSDRNAAIEVSAAATKAARTAATAAAATAAATAATASTAPAVAAAPVRVPADSAAPAASAAPAPAASAAPAVPMVPMVKKKNRVAPTSMAAAPTPAAPAAPATPAPTAAPTAPAEKKQRIAPTPMAAAAVAPPAAPLALPAAPAEKRPVSAAPGGETVSVEPKKKRLTPMPNPSPN